MTVPAEEPEADEIAGAKALFVRTARDYYVSGRFACLAHLVWVAGNLCHHAVEMMLKAHLLEQIREEVTACASNADRRQLIRKFLKRTLAKFGHDLPRLWKTFKSEVTATDLDRFDDTIDRLHKFEDLRYPDKTLKQGANISFGLVRSLVQATDGKGRPRSEARYNLGLKEIDDLIAAIFKAALINDRAFFPGGLSSDARSSLYQHNTAFREVDP